MIYHVLDLENGTVAFRCLRQGCSCMPALDRLGPGQTCFTFVYRQRAPGPLPPTTDAYRTPCHQKVLATRPEAHGTQLFTARPTVHGDCKQTKPRPVLSFIIRRPAHLPHSLPRFRSPDQYNNCPRTQQKPTPKTHQFSFDRHHDESEDVRRTHGLGIPEQPRARGCL